MSVQFTRPWDTGSLAGPLTTLKGGEMGHLGPQPRGENKKLVGFMIAAQYPPLSGWRGQSSGTCPPTSRPQLPPVRLPAQPVRDKHEEHVLTPREACGVNTIRENFS